MPFCKLWHIYMSNIWYKTCTYILITFLNHKCMIYNNLINCQILKVPKYRKTMECAWKKWAKKYSTVFKKLFSIWILHDTNMYPKKIPKNTKKIISLMQMH